MSYEAFVAEANAKALATVEGYRSMPGWDAARAKTVSLFAAWDAEDDRTGVTR